MSNQAVIDKATNCIWNIKRAIKQYNRSIKLARNMVNETNSNLELKMELQKHHHKLMQGYDLKLSRRIVLLKKQKAQREEVLQVLIDERRPFEMYAMRLRKCCYQLSKKNEYYNNAQYQAAIYQNVDVAVKNYQNLIRLKAGLYATQY